jgi:hypothetical protein
MVFAYNAFYSVTETQKNVIYVVSAIINSINGFTKQLQVKVALNLLYIYLDTNFC